jgi:diguanylate cyclase
VLRLGLKNFGLILLIASVLLLSFSTRANPIIEQVTVIKSGFSQADLNVPITTFQTSLDENLTPEQAILSEKFSINTFSKSLLPGEHISWQKISLRADLAKGQTKQLVLSLNNPIIRHLDVYLFDETGQRVAHQSFGSSDKTYSPKQARAAQDMHFSISDQQVLFLLIKKQSISPPILLIGLYEITAFEKFNLNRYMFWGGVIALLFGMGLYNGAIYSLTQNKAFSWYIAFYLISFFYFGAIHGFGSLLWSDAIQHWFVEHIMTMNFLLLWLVLRFSNVFLNAQQNAPKYHRWLLKLEWLIIIGLLTSLFVLEYKMIPFFALIQLVSSVFIVMLAVQCYRQGFFPARFFLLSWSFVLVGAGIGSATFLGVMPTSFISMHAFFFGVLIELLLLSVALADRIRYTESKAIIQAYTDPRTLQPNFSFFKSEYFQLPIIQKNNTQQYSMLLLQVEGVRNFLGLLGPNLMESAYRNHIANLEHFLQNRDWVVSFEVSPNIEKYMITLPGNHILVVVKTNNDLPEIIKSLLNLADLPMKLKEFEGNFNLRIGVAPLNQVNKANSSVTNPFIHEAYRQAQLALIHCENHSLKWCRFSREHDEIIREKLAIIADLREAVTSSQFEIYIQPQFSLSKHNLIGGEVLIRWFHPQRGMVSPAQFIPLAEQTDNIFAITKIVIEKSFSWFSHFPPSVSEQSHPFRLSINLSVQDIYRDELIPYISERLKHYQLNASHVVFEVTESAIIKDHTKFLAQISKLQALNFGIALDDFGTGYSSMSYMQKMNVDEIKIDLSFVRDIHLSTVNQKIVDAIIKMSQSTNAITVAEGIETEEELTVLKALGADAIQGYLSGKPVSAEEFSNLLSSQEAVKFEVNT